MYFWGDLVPTSQTVEYLLRTQGQKNNLSIVPITNFNRFANIFLIYDKFVLKIKLFKTKSLFTKNREKCLANSLWVTTAATLLNKRSYLAPTLGVTKFRAVKEYYFGHTLLCYLGPT